MKCALCLLPLPLEYIRRALVTQEKEQEKRGLSFPLSFVHFFIIHTRNDFEMPTTSQSVLGERERDRKKRKEDKAGVFSLFSKWGRRRPVSHYDSVLRRRKKIPHLATTSDRISMRPYYTARPRRSAYALFLGWMMMIRSSFPCLLSIVLCSYKPHTRVFQGFLVHFFFS